MAEVKKLLDSTSTMDMFTALFISGMGTGMLTALAHSLEHPHLDDAAKIAELEAITDRVMAKVLAGPGHMDSIRDQVMRVVSAHTVDIDAAVKAAEALANGEPT